MAISRCAFSNNLAIGADVGPDDNGGFGVGGAVSNGYSEAGSRITITNSVFTANQANGGKGGFDGVGTGGALNLESPCTTTIANCTFAGNQAISGGPSEGATFGGAIDQRNYGTGPGGGSGADLDDLELHVRRQPGQRAGPRRTQFRRGHPERKR